MALTSLRRARLELGITQLDLALKTHITPSRLSVLERGIVEPTPQEADRLAAALDISASAVMHQSRPTRVPEEGL